MLDTILKRTWLFLLLIAAVFTSYKLISGQSVQTSLFAMFPSHSQTQVLDIALEHASGVFEHDLIVMIEGDRSEDVINSANQFVVGLNGIETVQLVDEQQRTAFIKWLYQFRQQLITEQDLASIQDGESASLTQAALRRLYSPAGVNGQSFIHDPWQTFERYLLALIGQNHFNYQNGLLISHQEGKTQALLQLYLNQSAFSSDAIDDIKQLNSLTETIEQSQQVSFYRTGAGFFSAAAMELATTEISVIGGGALLLVIAVVIWLFAHPKPLGMTLLSLASGVLCGLAVTFLWFGEVHVLALVMGSSLIGLSFDYSFHYLSYLACQSPQESNNTVARRLRPALMLGVLSSVIAYSSLFLASLPVLNQMALFSVFGLIGALITVLLIYPSLAPFHGSPRTSRVAGQLSDWVNRWMQSSYLYWVLGVYVLVAIGALWVGYADDDIRLLQSPNEQLIQQERVIKQRLHTQGGSDWIITLADSAEKVAINEEALLAKLDVWLSQDKLTGYLAATQWIPSQQRQYENWHAYQLLIEQQGHPIADAVGMTELPKPISFQPLKSDALEGKGWVGVPSLSGQLDDGRYFSLVLLKGLSEPFDTQLLTADQHYLNYVDDIGNLLGDYRHRVAKLLFVAIALVVVVTAGYFGLRHSLRLMVSPILAVIIAASLPAALGMPITLFHVLGLFLIFGIGIDYSVFLMCHGRSSHTILAVFVAGISSLLSFGLMSLSSNYAIASFGITVGLGVLSSWLIAPMVLLGNKTND